jgi:hypothetical protein
VLRFWEHEIKSEFGNCLLKIFHEIDPETDPNIIF